MLRVALLSLCWPYLCLLASLGLLSRRRGDGVLLG